MNRGEPRFGFVDLSRNVKLPEGTLNKIAIAVLAVSLSAVAAFGQGNIAITGHDDDYHWSVDGGITTQAGVQIRAFATFTRKGSSLPLLVFDHGTELTNAITALGIAFTKVDPDTAANITDAMFNHATYSAMAVASDSSCGGCDNDTTGEANLASHITAIGTFLNAGGGIFAFAGANSPGYYAFLPQTPSSVGGAPSSGYSQTSAGATYGIPAVNGDPTHNLFYNPGTGGESAAFQIAEINATAGNGTILPPAAVTLICASCTVSGTTITTGPTSPGTAPAPSTLILMLCAIPAVLFGAKFLGRKTFQS